jgi:hypothetical protein
VRRCGRCGQDKPLAEFAWRRRAKGQRHNYCRPCHADYRREHYLANRRRYIALAQQRKAELQLERTQLLLEFFRLNPCIDCGETDPVVLEFDHLRDKSFSIGGKLTTQTWSAILAEIEKCEVVCSNCHRRRTARRRGSVRALLTISEPASELEDIPRTDKGPGEPGPPPCL